MSLFRIAIVVISLVTWGVQSRPIERRSEAVYSLHSKSLGRYVKMLVNGSVVATEYVENNNFSRDTLWRIQIDASDLAKLENVAYRDHYLSLAVGDDMYALVAHNISKPFTTQQLLLHQKISEETEILEQNNSTSMNNSSGGSDEDEAQVLLEFAWTYKLRQFGVQFVMFPEEDVECYLAFDNSGHSEDGCSDHTNSEFTVTLQELSN